MDIKDFIITCAKKISATFPHLLIRVEKNSLSGAFFVEISPSKEFRENSTLKKMLHEFYKEQIKNFSNESLSFISTDSYYKVSTPLLVVTPRQDYYNVTYNGIATKVLTFKDAINLLRRYDAVIPTIINLPLEHVQELDYSVCQFAFQFKRHSYLNIFSPLVNDLPKITEEKLGDLRIQASHLNSEKLIYGF